MAVIGRVAVGVPAQIGCDQIALLAERVDHREKFTVVRPQPRRLDTTGPLPAVT